MAFTITYEGDSTYALEAVLRESTGWFVEIDYDENGTTPVHVEGFVGPVEDGSPVAGTADVVTIHETVEGNCETRTGRELRIVLHEITDLNLP